MKRLIHFLYDCRQQRLYIMLISTWPFIATGAFVALLGYFTLKQPNRPGKRYFGLIVLAWLVWAIAAGVEQAASSSVGIRYAATQIQIFCALLLGPFALFFSLEYAGRRLWFSPYRMGLIMLPAFVIQILSLTNPFHNLFFSDLRFGAELLLVRTPAAWVGIGYNYILWLVTIMVLIECVLRSPAFIAPISLMILGQTIPRIAFLVAGPQWTPFSPLQLALLASNLTLLAYFLALFNYRLLRVLPIARDAVLERMDYGVIVLDAEEIVIDTNPAACMQLGLPGAKMIGQKACQALGHWWQHLSLLMDKELVIQELIMGNDSRQQVFEVSCQPVMNANGWIMGHAFILHDITPAWHHRQQLAQQQWMEATRQERQQLAEDLHDGLSQKLAFINLQSQAAQVFLQSDQSAEAQACLSRLVDETRQMQSNMRETIANSIVDNVTSVGFVDALRQILTSYENQTGQRVALILDGDTDTRCNSDIMDPNVTVQLLRIIQEALANVRLHAQNVREVQVNLACIDGELQVTIADDGSGFDMDAVRLSDSKHFGLYIMQKRATRIGAQFTIHSQINQGTLVKVKIPLATGEMRSAA